MAVLNLIDDILRFLDNIPIVHSTTTEIVGNADWVLSSEIPVFDQAESELNFKRVRRKQSQDGNFFIYTYEFETEMKKLWNDVNRWCRGIIFDANTKKVVAIGYKKFFNADQMPEVRLKLLEKKSLPARICEKLDGALGLLFFDSYERKLRVSTKGSLDSTEGRWGTGWINDLKNFESENQQKLFIDSVRDGEYTHLFEIIDPHFPKVVLYDYSGLVYHGSMNKESGRPEFRPELIPSHWRRCETFPIRSITQLFKEKVDLPPTKEGYVVTWEDGLMAKVKGKKYMALHKMRGNLTVKSIRDFLALGCGDAHFRKFPDEYYESIKNVREELTRRHAKLYQNISQTVKEAKRKFGNDKKQCSLFAQSKLPKALLGFFFVLLNERKINEKNFWSNVSLDGLEVVSFENKWKEPTHTYS